MPSTKSHPEHGSNRLMVNTLECEHIERHSRVQILHENREHYHGSRRANYTILRFEHIQIRKILSSVQRDAPKANRNNLLLHTHA